MPVWGRFHASEERYSATTLDLIPPKQPKGMRTYVMMHPVVLEPVMTLTVNLYDTPKRFADQEPAIGQTVGAPRMKGVKEMQVGNAQRGIIMRIGCWCCGSAFLMAASAGIPLVRM